LFWKEWRRVADGEQERKAWDRMCGGEKGFSLEVLEFLGM
jgi:hypothetical protein